MGLIPTQPTPISEIIVTTAPPNDAVESADIFYENTFNIPNEEDGSSNKNETINPFHQTGSVQHQTNIDLSFSKNDKISNNGDQMNLRIPDLYQIEAVKQTDEVTLRPELVEKLDNNYFVQKDFHNQIYDDDYYDYLNTGEAFASEQYDYGPNEYLNTEGDGGQTFRYRSRLRTQGPSTRISHRVSTSSNVKVI